MTASGRVDAAEVGYETLSDPTADETQWSLWLTTETGVIHRCCGPAEKVMELGIRHVNARVASRYELAECCHGTDAQCAFDTFGNVEDIDKVVILALALARAEGRDIGQPSRCAHHGALTFGGCCG